LGKPTMRQRKILSEYILKNQKRAGITLEEIAKRTGIPKGTLSDYKMMSRYPTRQYTPEEVMQKVRKSCERGETD